MKTVLHILSGDLWGGAEAQVALQLNAIIDEGWQPHLLLFNRGIVADRMSAQQLNLTILDESGGFGGLIQSAISESKRINPQIIVTHGYKEALIGFLAALKLRVPLIVTFHGLTEGLNGVKGIKLRCYQSVERAIARWYAARIITVSDALRRDLGFSSYQNVRVVRNTTVIESSEDPPMDYGSKNKISGNSTAIKLLALGRLAPVKRLDLLISALQIIKTDSASQGIADRIRLQIAGQGPEESALRTQAAQLKVENYIDFLGFQNNPLELLRSAAMLVISSDSEGIPTALLEALAAGTPLVATDVGGIREVLGQFGGYPAMLVPRRSAEALAAAIQTMVNAPRLGLDRAAINRTLLNSFSPSAAAKAHCQIYEELTGKNKNPGEGTNAPTGLG